MKNIICKTRIRKHIDDKIPYYTIDFKYKDSFWDIVFFNRRTFEELYEKPSYTIRTYGVERVRVMNLPNIAIFFSLKEAIEIAEELIGKDEWHYRSTKPIIKEFGE